MKKALFILLTIFWSNVMYDRWLNDYKEMHE